MALYAPIVLMAMVVVWLALLIAAFTHDLPRGRGQRRVPGVQRGGLVAVHPRVRAPERRRRDRRRLPGGIVRPRARGAPDRLPPDDLRVLLAARGARRVPDSRAGTPPSAIDLLRRAHLIDRLHDLDDLWDQLQLWFAELEETHTSQPLLNFFRSPSADRSWVTAAGTILDAASLINSTDRRGVAPHGGALRAQRVHRAALHRRLLRHATTRRIPGPTTRSRSPATSGSGTRRTSPRPGSRSWPTSTRRGATSPGGGSTTTPCSSRSPA